MPNGMLSMPYGRLHVAGRKSRTGTKRRAGCGQGAFRRGGPAEAGAADAGSDARGMFVSDLNVVLVGWLGLKGFFSVSSMFQVFVLSLAALFRPFGLSRLTVRR